jgi:hypothetical protein
MVVEALANLPLDLSDLFVECGDDLPNRGCNDGRVRRLCVHRLLRSGFLEMVVMPD